MYCPKRDRRIKDIYSNCRLARKFSGSEVVHVLQKTLVGGIFFYYSHNSHKPLTL
jgi:hypothetical protein